jgi:hypothetical protein
VFWKEKEVEGLVDVLEVVMRGFAESIDENYLFHSIAISKPDNVVRAFVNVSRYPAKLLSAENFLRQQTLMIARLLTEFDMCSSMVKLFMRCHSPERLRLSLLFVPTEAGNFHHRS